MPLCHFLTLPPLSFVCMSMVVADESGIGFVAAVAVAVVVELHMIALH